MIKMVPMTCPRCGASIEVRDDIGTCFCIYCGTKIVISDDNNKHYTKNVNINQTSYDRTEIERIKLEHDLKVQDEKREIKMGIIALIVLWGIVILLTAFAQIKI